MNRIALLVLVFATQTFAGMGEDFAKLKNSGSDYTVVGTICEDVTKLRFEEEFPSTKFEVVTGVEYNDGNRTIGELDVVVFDRLTQKAVRVSEVKCWKDMNGALAKARNQRQRFINHLKSNLPIYFRSLRSQHQFKEANFLSVTDFAAVAQKGSKAVGFERELPYELRELMQLRQMMISCQNQRQCARPQMSR
ncbi:MAG: hypothetical protein ACK5Y2_01790 [Bdellovibrionales bacterium]